MVEKKQKYYSLREAIKLTPIKARETLARYINRYQGAAWSVGKVWIKKREVRKGVTSMRYIISNDWIKTFNKLYKADKLIEHSVFKPDSPRYTLDDIEDYCFKKKITEVAVFIHKKRNEEKRSVPLIGNNQ